MVLWAEPKYIRSFKIYHFSWWDRRPGAVKVYLVVDNSRLELLYCRIWVVFCWMNASMMNPRWMIRSLARCYLSCVAAIVALYKGIYLSLLYQYFLFSHIVSFLLFKLEFIVMFHSYRVMLLICWWTIPLKTWLSSMENFQVLWTNWQLKDSVMTPSRYLLTYLLVPCLLIHLLKGWWSKWFWYHYITWRNNEFSC